MSSYGVSSSVLTSSSSASIAAVTAAADVHTKDNTDLAPLLNEMFEKLSTYANGEIEASCEEYQLLEKLNLHAAKKVRQTRESERERAEGNTHRNTQREIHHAC